MTESHPEKKIIVIPAKNESPQEQAKKRNLRVAAYCRVSTGDEEQLTSYENQKAFYTEKIMKNPEWTMVDIFADEGITGTSTCRRKDFLRMIRQCRQGKIDMILAKSVSRFARNTLDTISYTRELRSLGIAVIFEEQNINSIYPESEFLIALHAAFAQSESESISANVRWGKRQSIKDGKVTFQYKTLLGYGRKYCLNSPTLDEEPLQQAILNAINSVMSDHSALAEQLRDTMEQELAPIPGESMSLGDIDRAIADLGRQFTALLSEAADADNADGYTARFQSISTAMAEFKRRKAIIQQLRQEQDQANHRMQRVTMALKSTSNKLTDWDDGTIYQLLEKVTVLSRERVRVTLRDGLEIEQAVEQPKRRKFI